MRNWKGCWIDWRQLRYCGWHLPVVDRFSLSAAATTTWCTTGMRQEIEKCERVHRGLSKKLKVLMHHQLGGTPTDPNPRVAWLGYMAA